MNRAALLILFCFIISGCATAPYQQPVIAPQGGVYHIVGSGQTLYRISKAYGADIKELLRVNHIKDPDQIGVGEKLFIPGARFPAVVEPYKPQNFESIDKLIGRKEAKVKWRYITVHHSATLEGNAGAFDRNHRHRRMGGLFYHFVIGNGHGAEDGEIEVGWRWARQAEVNRRGDIQICLVGDFNRQELTAEQFSALSRLIKVLKSRYNIPAYNIRGHKDIRGCKPTECPGDHFNLRKVMAEIERIG